MLVLVAVTHTTVRAAVASLSHADTRELTHSSHPPTLFCDTYAFTHTDWVLYSMCSNEVVLRLPISLSDNAAHGTG